MMSPIKVFRNKVKTILNASPVLNILLNCILGTSQGLYVCIFLKTVKMKNTPVKVFVWYAVVALHNGSCQ